MENEHNEYQYKYDHEIDILLKSANGKKWFYFGDKENGEPIYDENEKYILNRERELYQEAEDRWTEEQIKMLDDPDYWENQLEYYSEYFNDEQIDQVNEMIEDTSKNNIKNEVQSNQEISTFPVNALPYGIKDIVVAGQEAFNVSNEFFALPSLVACASAIGSKFEVALNNTLSTKPIIYACLIAMPGSGKSPAQNIAMKPLYKLQSEALSNYNSENDVYETEIKKYEGAEKKAKQDKKDFNLEQPKKPRLKEFYTTNSTIEGIAKILKRNPSGIIYINDEFLGFYNSLNSYKSGKGSDLQEWLSLWNGNELKINRKSDEIPLTVNDPYVSIVGNMTPSGIKQIAENSNTENGFLDRFLFSYPTDSKPFVVTEKGIHIEIQNKYYNLIKNLINIETDYDNKYIKLSKSAMEEYKNYCNRTNEIAGDTEKLRSIVAKLQMYSVRFALVGHLCEQQNPNSVKYETIQKDSMEKAILLCDYFFSQANKIYNKLESTETDELIERALKVIDKHKQLDDSGKYIIKRRDIQRGIKGLKGEALDDLMDELIEKEILDVMEEGKKGSIIYEVFK